MTRRAVAVGLRTTGAAVLAGTLLASASCRTAGHDPARIARLEPELGQLVLAGFTGTEAAGNRQLEELLCRSRVGGIIVFARNVVDTTQITRLTSAMQTMSRACTGRPLLIAVDAEGGRVMRLGPPAGYTATLSHQELGDGNDFALTELEARRIGRMLSTAGMNWNLAPVVDVGYNPANPVIVGHGRSFSANPGLVTAHARAYVRGMRAEGVLTALKHFPGHGSSFADSHLGFVDVTETADRDTELAPYRALLAERLVDSVMTAHVVNRQLDARYPATLSAPTIGGLLRQGLGYDGLVVSDDLRMGAIETQYGLEKAAVLALRAGIDLLVIADDRLPDGRSATEVGLGAIREALVAGHLSPERVESALRRLREFTARLAR